MAVQRPDIVLLVLDARRVDELLSQLAAFVSHGPTLAPLPEGIATKRTPKCVSACATCYLE